MPHEILPKTSHGGSTSSIITTTSLGASLAHALLRTKAHSQMPAQALESGSSFPEGGGHGALSLGGKRKAETLDGQKLLASSFLSALSPRSAALENTSESLATIGELLKAGGKVEAATKRQISSSDESTTSRLLTSALLSRAMCPAKKIQLMDPRVESTPQLLRCYLLSAFPKNSNNSSSTTIANLFPVSVISRLKEMHLNPSQNPSEMPRGATLTSFSTSSATLNGSRPRNPPNRPNAHDRNACNPPTFTDAASTARPSAYSPRLTPNASVLRPHCLARDRLRLWKPPTPFSALRHAGIADEDIKRIFNVMSNAWAESTHEAYSSGLLVWHVHCDRRSIPEAQRAPAHQSHLSSFVATLAGSYSASTISNYLSGLRAWHILHSVEWKLDALEMEALLKGAARLAPESSKRKLRQPYTPEFITKVGEQLNLNDPHDASVFACLTDGFYGVVRLGELTVPRLTAFNPAEHVTRANLRTETNQSGMETTVLHIPKTKSAPIEGEDVFWSRQHGPTDPCEALANHLRINKPSNSDHLFAYLHKGRLRPLTKPAFIKRVATAARAAGLEPLQGHGIRIGATLLYLLRGVPMEAMKVMGRWSSDAFMRYLRKHAQILTPYIQADPQLHQAFSHFTLPSQAMLQGRR